MLTEQKFRANLQRILDAVNQREWDVFDAVVDDLFAADYLWHVPDPIHGSEGFKQFIRNVVDATPGYRAEIGDVLFMGNKAAARLTEYRTDPDTRKTQHCTSLMINHLKEEKFAEDWQLMGPWEDEA